VFPIVWIVGYSYFLNLAALRSGIVESSLVHARGME
jgi:hypothetical protein